MSAFITVLTLALLLVQSVPGHGRSAILYNDGALIEQDAVANKGTLELPLPADMIQGSLRVRPAGGTSILSVEVLPAPADSGKGEKELNTLLEQRNRLGDRMEALATREEIFRSAAKSQSGKAPRKTKANPEPLQSIRQGTDFAIAQLEAVYTARRRTEQEIKRLDGRIAAAKITAGARDAVARIQLAPARGRVTVRYAVSGQNWVPRYDFHLDSGNTAQVHLSALISGAFSGYLLQASPAPLSEHGRARLFPVPAGAPRRLTSFSLPVSEVRFGDSIQSSFTFVAHNPEPTHLPGGDASLYKNGEYVGRFRFDGISSGRSRRVSRWM